MADHERIYLQPQCCAGDEGRLWCEDSGVWDECPEHGEETEYVRADLYERLQARVAELEAENKAANFRIDELEAQALQDKGDT